MLKTLKIHDLRILHLTHRDSSTCNIGSTHTDPTSISSEFLKSIDFMPLSGMLFYAVLDYGNRKREVLNSAVGRTHLKPWGRLYPTLNPVSCTHSCCSSYWSMNHLKM